jgi:hypothetical protein
VRFANIDIVLYRARKSTRCLIDVCTLTQLWHLVLIAWALWQDRLLIPWLGWLVICLPNWRARAMRGGVSPLRRSATTFSQLVMRCASFSRRPALVRCMLLCRLTECMLQSGAMCVSVKQFITQASNVVM